VDPAGLIGTVDRYHFSFLDRARSLTAHASSTRNDTVTIRPGVGMLGLLASMNYKPWYALSEFVDNALASRLANAAALAEAGADRLEVTIKFDSGLGEITITDNAAGIAGADVDRAFKSAEPPPDASGLSQFGIGMKAAACWYARRFTVTSTALGEPVRRTVTFDVPAIIESNQDELPVDVEPAPPEQHGTTIVLSDLHRPIPTGRTLGKIRDYLGSIYRSYLGPDLRLLVKEVEVGFQPPPILVRPRWDAEDRTVEETWKKDVKIALPGGKTVRGWAALRETGSTREAGLALLYRGKVVVGAGAGARQQEDLYRPSEIFGAGNSFVSQRLFGELDVSELRVTHSKDAIIWDGQEEVLLTELRRQLDAEPLPLLRMANRHRVNERSAEAAEQVREAAETTAAAAAGTELPETAPEEVDEPIDGDEVVGGDEPSTALAFEAVEAPFNIAIGGTSVNVVLTVSDAPHEMWVRIDDQENGYLITVTRDHPFMRSFAHLPNQDIEPVLRLAVGLGVAEIAARRSGARGAPQVRAQLNQALRGRLGSATIEDLREAGS
jgi:hypothetical protein